MLRILEVAYQWITVVRTIVRAVERHDRGLATQLREASRSVVLNLAEGAGACGGDKRRAYRIALREMREAIAAIRLAVLFEYVAPMNAVDADRQDHVLATLVRLARP